MRVQVAAVVLGALAALAGGWLVGRWCLGLVVIAEAAALVAYGVWGYDDGQEQGPQAEYVDALERARRAA